MEENSLLQYGAASLKNFHGTKLVLPQQAWKISFDKKAMGGACGTFVPFALKGDCLPGAGPLLVFLWSCSCSASSSSTGRWGRCCCPASSCSKGQVVSSQRTVCSAGAERYQGTHRRMERAHMEGSEDGAGKDKKEDSPKSFH